MNGIERAPTVARDAKGWLLPGAVLNPNGRALGWREALKRVVGQNGERLWEAMMRIAEGRPLIPIEPGGKQGPPIVPTAADALRAQIELAHLFAGRPVGADQIMLAEQASHEMAAIREMDDRALARAASAIITRMEAQRRGITEGELVGESPKQKACQPVKAKAE